MSIKRYGLLATLVFAMLPAAQAQSSPSLNDRRLGVIKATPAPQPAAPESAASAASPTSTGAPGKPAAETAKTPAKALPTLPAPSGRPINEARRAESAPSGIVLPTAGSASQAKPKTGP